MFLGKLQNLKLQAQKIFTKQSNPEQCSIKRTEDAVKVESKNRMKHNINTVLIAFRKT